MSNHAIEKWTPLRVGPAARGDAVKPMPPWFAVISVFGLLSFPVHGRSPEEVACEERKLGRLIHRLAGYQARENVMVWNTAGDRYSGLLVTDPFDPYDFAARRTLIRFERQLGFDLVLSEGAGLLNPRRPFLPQATLVRNDLKSTLVERFGEGWRILRFALWPVVDDPRDSISPSLNIENALPPSPSAASGVGRGLALDELFEACSSEPPSPSDLQIFELLARTFRPTHGLTPDGSVSSLYKTAIFRDTEPLSYRANVYIYYDLCLDCAYTEELVALRFRFTLDSSGKLATGSIEALPWCQTEGQLGCTRHAMPRSNFLVLPPIFAGNEVQAPTTEQIFGGVFLNVVSADSSDNILTDDVPWPDLLRGTAWDRPLGVP